MIKVKTFTSQLKIFHAQNELAALDKEVDDFIVSAGIRKVVSVSDAATTGEKGETIGLIRVLAYEDPATGAREKYQEKIESALQEVGEEVDKLRSKAEKLGAQAKTRYRGQIDELHVRRETARRKLEELAKTGGEAWEDIRKASESAVDELKKGVENVVARMKKR